MSLSNQLAYMSASELASRIRRRELSPVDVTQAFIERIEERNSSINALIYFGFDDARNAAKRAEQALMSGEEIGPLHGVPTAIKDLFDFKPGWISTFGGIRAFRQNVVDFSCLYTERMEKAGAIIVGKTNSPLLGLRGTCDNYLFGPTRNPFDLSKNSGGSSGGSAAAVADGLLPIAEGTDGGGSIRIPASWCGVYGYKASFGRVPYTGRPNAFGGTMPFLYEGPITRTVEDAAISMNVLSGYDPRDPFSLPDEIDFTKALTRSMKGWRIAYSSDFDIFPVDHKVKEVVARAVSAFTEAGAHVEEVRLGIKYTHRELSDLLSRLIMPGGVRMLDSMKEGGLDLLSDHRDDFPPQVLEWLEKASRISAQDVIRDQEMRTHIYDAIQGVFEKYDLLITPTLACLPVDNAADGNTVGPSMINGEDVDPLIGWCMTYFMNFTGHPAASIPAGLADNHLPVGMQIIGKRYADADVLTASAVFERIRPWHQHYERCANRLVTS
ncbi:amidase [uncultured Brevibacillus sp.]|uniref:amidase n=1 Tax=uncultured Brevibacillus sp. TaxID=169970 RepID=UPI00259A4FF3|nr:amidase [uncultured Brevibacillus sp.]